MRAGFRKAAAIGLVLAMGMTALTGCGNKKAEKIDSAKTLMTVNGEDVRLGVGSFLAKFEQAQVYQLYNMYFGVTSNIFDNEEDEESHTTYGDSLKESVISDLKKMVVISQHAEEYGVSLTDEQKTQIEEAAQAYIDGNDQEILDKIGAEKDDVVRLMTLQTLQAEMMDPIVKDVDTEVSDEEAQQATLSYIPVPIEEEEEAADSGEESAEEEAEEAASEAEAAAEEAVSEVASAAEEAVSEAASAAEEAVSEAASAAEEAVSEAASAAEEAVSEAASAAEEAVSEAASAAEEAEAAPAEETEAQKAARESAEAIIAAITAAGNVAEADMDQFAKDASEDYYSLKGQYTVSDHEDSSQDMNLIDAVQGLEDGTLVDHPVLDEEGKNYYVVRLDHNFDESATENKKKSIIRERKQDLFDETADKWVEEAEITVDEDAWKAVTITDSDPLTLKVPAAESTAEEAEEAESVPEEVMSAAEEVASEEAGAVSEAAEAAEDAASAVADAAEEAVSEAAGAVSEAAEAAEDAASAVADAAEEAVSEAAGAVSEAAEAAEGAVSAAADAAEEAVSAAAGEVSEAAEAAGDAASAVVSAVESAAN